MEYNMNNIDGVKCVVCLENQADRFCSTCKKASGVCFDCYLQLNEDTYGGIGNGGEYYEAIECVICNEEMHHANLMQVLNMDILSGDGVENFEDYVSEEKRYKLLEIVYENSNL
jgi:hypothetical protein